VIVRDIIKILHLEDFLPDAELIEKALRKSDLKFDKFLVKTGQEYERYLDEYSPDIVLADHSLPSFDSIAALRILKDKDPKIPFILVTATVSEEYAVEIMKQGADDYIIKDRLQRLPNAILNALEKKRIAAQRQSFLNEIIANEALLAETEALANIGSFRIDLVARSSRWSEKLYDIMNYDHTATPSLRNFLQRIHPADLESVKKFIKTHTGGSDSTDIDYRIKTAKGIKHVYSKILVEKGEDGRPVFVTGFIHDITDRKKVEAELLYRETRLNQAQSIAKLGSWELNFATGVAIWSDEACRIYGISPLENKQSYESWKSFIHPDDLAHAMKMAGESQASLTNASFYYRIVLKDGTVKYIYSQTHFDFNEEGNVIGLYGIVHDVTEQKIAEKERAKMTDDIIRRNKNLEQFAYIVSHNLRAPVANILGASNHLIASKLDASEKNVLINGLNDAALKLDGVVNDLNSILQVRREADADKEKVRFSELVDHIKISIRNIIEPSGIDIITDFSAIDEMYTVKGYLYSIFYNLISNGIKYRRRQTGSILAINSYLTGNRIGLTFRDNGLGIDIQKKGDQVFGLYKRFHPGIEGKGMGLYMVKTQVEALKGNIQVISEVNKGTEFKIEFEL
jgi:PAS domain S-box-containing protein